MILDYYWFICQLFCKCSRMGSIKFWIVFKNVGIHCFWEHIFSVLSLHFWIDIYLWEKWGFFFRISKIITHLMVYTAVHSVSLHSRIGLHNRNVNLCRCWWKSFNLIVQSYWWSKVFGFYCVSKWVVHVFCQVFD